MLLLLAHGATVKVKNAQGWTPLSEAISYGDRQISMYSDFDHCMLPSVLAFGIVLILVLCDA